MGGSWELRSEALRGRAASDRRILARGSAHQLGNASGGEWGRPRLEDEGFLERRGAALCLGAAQV